MKLKILDYAAHELPVVCTPIAAAGYPENEGLVVRTDVDDLVQAIDWLAKTPAECRRLGRVIAHEFAALYSWDAVARWILAAYASLRGGPIEKPMLATDRWGRITLDGEPLPEPMHLRERRYVEAQRSMISEMVEL